MKIRKVFVGPVDLHVSPGSLVAEFADRRTATVQRRARGTGNPSGAYTRTTVCLDRKWGRRANDKEAHQECRNPKSCGGLFPAGTPAVLCRRKGDERRNLPTTPMFALLANLHFYRRKGDDRRSHKDRRDVQHYVVFEWGQYHTGNKSKYITCRRGKDSDRRKS